MVLWTTPVFGAVIHSAPASPLVPHWAVLVVAVPLLWLVIGGVVIALDRLLWSIAR
ncbi:hypothetical protein NDI56_05590 [Haloarcula sp. S1CR25-12]|uniref:Uncharacterized protein n=1 Tax=Haloarcula saliterrae TaxID=2950534 RepID=A0ABU2F9A0_9EURY|nr:hypothetical protein [Haloarcula sp. S1CR25-12]MDS0258863.1 hypothetical protein [Haloarcula sp. S1CR25-12]